MTFVRHSRVLPAMLWRPAIFFFALSQMALAFAPLGEGRFGKSAQSHVEAAGTTAHHAHNHADCNACTARSMLAGLPENAAQLYFSRAIAPSRAERSLTLTSLSEPGSRPRAPPVRQA